MAKFIFILKIEELMLALELFFDYVIKKLSCIKS